MYSSASEVVREALRLLAENDAQRSVAESAPAYGSDASQRLEVVQWRELREALLRGESGLMEERFAELAELFQAGLELTRIRLAREFPDAPETELEMRLAQWLRERAGEPTGDEFGRPVSEARRRRILGE